MSQETENKLSAELVRVTRMREYYALAETQLQKGEDATAHRVGEQASSQGIMMDAALAAGKAALDNPTDEAIDAALVTLASFQ